MKKIKKAVKCITSHMLVASLMLSSMTGCGKAAGNSAVAQGNEEVTIDIYMESSGENPIIAGIQENAVAQYIKEQTGVTMNVIIRNSDKTKAMAASGDLYDLSNIDFTHVASLIQSGAIQSLDDHLIYALDFCENFPEMINYSREYLSNGEKKLYAILARGKVQASPLATSRYGNFISWEHYKEAGKKEITSVDDFLNLLKTIQENHPETESGKKTYGISRFIDWGISHSLSDPVLWKYCAQYPINELSTFDITDLTYVDLYNEENIYWQTAEMYFKANQMGLLDPEIYTQKNEDYSRKIGEGQILFSAMEWDFDAINAELNEQGGTDKWMDIPWVDSEEFPAWISRASEFGMSARTFVVSSKCDETKMRGIARLLNFLFSEDGARTVMNGPKGVTWDYDENGVAVFTEDCKQKLAENPNYLLEQGANCYLGIIGQDYDALAISEANAGKYIDIRLNSEYVQQNLNQAELEYCEFYNVEVPLEVATTRKNQSTIYEGYLNLMPAENPANIQRSVVRISDYLAQAVPAMVFSETEEEYRLRYAEIQADLKNRGYDEVTEYFENAWNEAIARYNSLIAK